MNGTIYQRIEDNAHFRELVEKSWFATILSIIMLAVYIGFILLIAFAPGWLGTPLNPNTSVTRGIPIGVGVIVISFVDPVSTSGGRTANSTVLIMKSCMRYKHHERVLTALAATLPFPQLTPRMLLAGP